MRPPPRAGVWKPRSFTAWMQLGLGDLEPFIIFKESAVILRVNHRTGALPSRKEVNNALPICLV